MGPERHLTSRGARIYRLPLDLFPGLKGYAHLVLTRELAVLVDAGSGFGDSNDQLEAGLASVRGEFEEDVSWDSLTHVVITHGHIDHFGGLPFVRRLTRAAVGVHEHDRRVLSQYEDRLAIMIPRMRRFLVEAGVEPARREDLMQLYVMTKHLYASQPVDFTLEAIGMRLGDIEILHVPGHCPGQVVLRVDDVLLSSDHVLPETSPHQSPEELSRYTGLGHYLESLGRLKPWAAQVRLTLGGHEQPFEHLAARIEAIESFHDERLERVCRELTAPRSLAELAAVLFPQTTAYHTWLALEETAAHVEYLMQRGAVGEDPAGGGEGRVRRFERKGPWDLRRHPETQTRSSIEARESAHGGVREERAHVRV